MHPFGHPFGTLRLYNIHPTPLALFLYTHLFSRRNIIVLKTGKNGNGIADVELINGCNFGLARRHFIGEDEIKRTPVRMLVDTCCCMLAINESINEIQQLPVVERRKGELANGEIVNPAHPYFAQLKM